MNKFLYISYEKQGIQSFFINVTKAFKIYIHVHVYTVQIYIIVQTRGKSIGTKTTIAVIRDVHVWWLINMLITKNSIQPNIVL